MSWKYRYALKNLVLKDFKIRYRNMSLGILWSLLNPLVMLGVLVFVFSYVHPQPDRRFFPVFLLLGLIPFNFFSLCISASTGSIVENASLIKKVIFPRYILPVSVVLSQCIHLLIQLFLLVFFILLLRVPVTTTSLWLLVALAVELLFILGLSLITSTLNVYFRDVQYVVQSMLTILFWFTPVFYALGNAHQNLSRPLYLLFIANPLAGCIEAARRGVLYGSAPELDSFLAAMVVSAVTLVVGVWTFARLQRRFSDHV